MTIRDFLKKCFNPELNLEGLEDHAFSVEEILLLTPTKEHVRRQIAMTYESPIYIWFTKPDRTNSATHLYEAGLRKNKYELLSMPNLPTETRRYMEKHVLT